MGGNPLKEVAVVILNWNGKHWLEKFLTNVIKNSPEADVIVIDNGSTDDSIHYLESNFPFTQIIKLDENYGFCGGYNQGLISLAHKYFLLLNSDIEVTENWLSPLLFTIKSENTIGIVQPKILDYKNKSKFEYAGASGGYIDRFGYPFCRGRIFDSLEEDNFQHQSVEEVVWASGASLLIKSDVWRSLKGLDEKFFAHMEEIDLCWRAQNYGYKVMVNPGSTVYHYGGGTLPKNDPRKTFLNFRNGLYLMYKNLPTRQLIFTLFIRLILDGVAALYFLVKGHPKDFKAVFKAHIAFYKSFRQMERCEMKKMPKKMYNRSIVLDHFIRNIKLFEELKV